MAPKVSIVIPVYNGMPYVQGAVESGRTTSEILLEDMKTAEPIVTVEAGEEVLIYFMEALNET